VIATYPTATRFLNTGTWVEEITASYWPWITPAIIAAADVYDAAVTIALLVTRVWPTAESLSVTTVELREIVLVVELVLDVLAIVESIVPSTAATTATTSTIQPPTPIAPIQSPSTTSSAANQPEPTDAAITVHHYLPTTTTAAAAIVSTVPTTVHATPAAPITSATIITTLGDKGQGVPRTIGLSPGGG